MIDRSAHASAGLGRLPLSLLSPNPLPKQRLGGLGSGSGPGLPPTRAASAGGLRGETLGGAERSLASGGGAGSGVWGGGALGQCPAEGRRDHGATAGAGGGVPEPPAGLPEARRDLHEGARRRRLRAPRPSGCSEVNRIKLGFFSSAPP